MARTVTRQNGAAKRAATEGAQRMTTRATRSSGSENSDESIGEVVKLVGGDDLDQDRPAKVAKRSSSGEREDDGPIQSSPLSTIAVDSEHLVPDDYGSEIESQAEEAGLQEQDEDAVVEADRNGFEEELQSQLQSRAVSASQRTTPALGSRQVSPSKPSSRSPTKLKGRRVKVGQPGNGRATPDPGEPGGLLKRLPGRRRAPHPDLNIEVDLRRQLELKIAYRAVAKALKPVLLELADRTARELEADENLHKQYPEYQDIVEELDSRLQQRLGILEAQLQEEETRLERDYQAKQEIARERYIIALQDEGDDNLLICENALMSLAHELREEEDSDATEYEDDIVPSLYRIDTATQTRKKVGKAYDSRSRWFIETQRLWDSQSARCGLRNVQDAVDKDSLESKPKGFAVYDGAQRAAAVSSLNLLQLIDAGEEVEDNARQLKMLSEAPNPALRVLADISTNQPPAQPDMTPSKPSNGGKAQSDDAAAKSVNGSLSATKPPAQPQSQPGSQKKSAARKHKALKNTQIPLYLPDPGMSPITGAYPPYGYFPYYMPYPYPPLPPGVEPGSSNMESAKYAFEAEQPASEGQHRKASLTDASQPTPNGMPQASSSGAAETLMRNAGSFVERQEASRSQPRDHETQTRTAFHPPYSNNSATGALYHPRYVDDKGLVKPPSPAANDSAAQGPSNPNEWPGFSNRPTTSHGRAASFDTNFARPPTFPMLAPSAVLDKSMHSQPPMIKADDVANKERRSASSPDAPNFEAFWSSQMSQASLPTQAPNTTSHGTHQDASFMGFPYSHQPSVPPTSRFTHPKRESPTPDSKQSVRPPSGSTPPFRNPYDVGFSPSRFSQGLTRPISRSSRPASPLTKGPVWSSNMTQNAQRNPESRPSSPMAQVRANWGMQAPPSNAQQASAATPQRFPSLQPQPPQPQVQLQRPGQLGHQRILPASLDPSRRPSQDIVPKSDQGLDGMEKRDRAPAYHNQQPSSQTQQHQPHSLYSPHSSHSNSAERRPSAFSSRHSSYQQPSASSTSPSTNLLGQHQRQAPAHQQAQTAPHPQPSNQPQAQMRSPSQPPDQKSMQSRFPVSHLSLPDNSSINANTSNFISTSSSSNTGAGRSSSRGRKEPRQPGQLRWQHYANIAPAPSASAAPTTPSPAAYPSASYSQQSLAHQQSQPQQQPQQPQQPQQQQSTFQAQQRTFTPSSMRQPPYHHQAQSHPQPQSQPQPQRHAHMHTRQLQAFTHNQQHPATNGAEASPAPLHSASSAAPSSVNNDPAQEGADAQALTASHTIQTRADDR